MSTVPELMTEAQGLLKKAARATADSNDLLRWLNECRRRLQRKAKTKRFWTVPVTGGTEAYSLATDTYPISTLRSALYIPTGATTGTPIDILPLERRFETGLRFQEALPGESGHTLYVWPTSLAGTIELHGDLRLPVLTNSDASIPAIAEDFHDLFPLFAACRYGGQDEDFSSIGRFPAFERQYLMREAEFMAEMSKGGRTTRCIRPSRRWV